jgi:mycothiol synthase
MGIAQYLKRTSLARYVKRVLRGPERVLTPPLLRMLRKLHPGEPLPAPTLVEPYRLQHYVPGDEEQWIELLNASGEFGTWDDARLSRELLATLLPDGGIFVTHRGRLVGCASACAMDEYRPHAILMYVAVLAEHRGQGLGQALVWETLRVARHEQFPGLLLHTENHRLAAVRTYFQLGFLPRLAPGAAGAEQWAEVLKGALLQG